MDDNNGAPACEVCGTLTIRSGDTWRCLNCGASMAVTVRPLDVVLDTLEATVSAKKDAHIARLEAQVRELEGLLDLYERRWRFDDNQQHTHTWHDREDCIAARHNAALRAAGEGK
jgi:hypothetical protein